MSIGTIGQNILYIRTTIIYKKWNNKNEEFYVKVINIFKLPNSKGLKINTIRMFK